MSAELSNQTIITGTSEGDVLVGDDQNNIIDGLAGDDEIQTGAGDDVVYGGEGRDRITVGAGNNFVDAGAGDDDLLTQNDEQASSNVFVGGEGNDHIYDNDGGHDVYLFNRGDGEDTIDDYDRFAGTPMQGYDRLQFGPGISRDDLTLEYSDYGQDLIIVINENGQPTGDRIVILQARENAANSIEEVSFADGSRLTQAELFSLPQFASDAADDVHNHHEQFANSEVHAGDGNDFIHVEEGNHTVFAGGGDDHILADTYPDSSSESVNTFSGGEGNDRIESYGNSNDRYLFNRGDGQDVIVDQVDYGYYPSDGTGSNGLMSGYDRIVFGPGITVDDLTIRREGDDLIIIIADREADYDYPDERDQITLEGAYLEGGMTIEEVVFTPPAPAENEGYDPFNPDQPQNPVQNISGDALFDLPQQPLAGGVSEWDDFVHGDVGDDVIDAGAGNDTVLDRGGNNRLYGGEGADTIEIDADGQPGEQNILSGGRGDDYMISRGGSSDTYLFQRGDGHDIIEDYASPEGEGLLAVDSVLFTDIRGDELRFWRQGNDLVLTLDHSDQITVAGFYLEQGRQIETLFFADGFTISGTQLHDLAFEEGVVVEAANITEGWAGVQRGSWDSDHLEADPAASANTFVGNGGDDYLSSQSGSSDTYWFQRGDGRDTIDDFDPAQGSDQQGVDRIQFGADISRTDLSLRLQGDDVVIVIRDEFGFVTGDEITIRNANFGREYQIEGLFFADGTSLQGDALFDLPLFGTDDNDSINEHNPFFDNPFGDPGGMTVYGERGDDQISLRGSGNLLNGGEGNDFLSVENSTSTTAFNTFVGGRGNDEMFSSGGSNDIYRFDRGDGQDTIVDINFGGEGGEDKDGYDRIEFGSGIAREDLSIRREGDDLVLMIANQNGEFFDDQITIMHAYDEHGASTIEEVVFADGSRLVGDELFALPQYGSWGDDSIEGSLVDDEIYGGEGNDDIVDRGGNNQLFGGQGDDIIRVEASPDSVQPDPFDPNPVQPTRPSSNTIVGGAGNDTIESYGSNDLYLFSRGDGKDVISDRDGSFDIPGYDRIHFGAGISKDDLRIRRESNAEWGDDDLLVMIYQDGQPTGDEIRIVSAYTHNDLDRVGIEEFSFADGSRLIGGQLFSLPQYGTGGDDVFRAGNSDDAIYAGDGNDEIWVEGGNNHIDAGAGDDQILSLGSSNGELAQNVLIGGKGNDLFFGFGAHDTYRFNRGDGQDTIAESRSDEEFDVIEFGAGIGLDDLSLYRDGDHMIIRLHESGQLTGDQIRIEHAYSNERSPIEQIQFADGSTLSGDQLFSLPQYGTDGGDFEMIGGKWGETLVGQDGMDAIYGEGGDDVLIGGRGSDLLIGDSITSDADGGSDTYRFAAGDGRDWLFNPADNNSPSTIDIAVFEQASYEDLWFSRTGDDLMINRVGTDDSVQVISWFENENFELDQIEVDGAVLLNNQVDLLVNAMAAFDAPDGVGDIVPQEVKDELQVALAETWQVA